MNPYGFRHLVPNDISWSQSETGELVDTFASDEVSIAALVEILNRLYASTDKYMKFTLYDLLGATMSKSVRNTDVLMSSRLFFPHQVSLSLAPLIYGEYQSAHSFDYQLRDQPNGITLQPFAIVKRVIQEYEANMDRNNNNYSDYGLYRTLLKYSARNPDQRVKEYLTYICQYVAECDKISLISAWSHQEKKTLRKLDSLMTSSDTYFSYLPRDISDYLIRPYLENANYAQ